MNKKKKPDSMLLVIGIAAILVGFGGIGYVPGRPVTSSAIFAMVAVVGVIITAFYGMALKAYKHYVQERTARTKKFCPQVKEYRIRESKSSAA